MIEESKKNQEEFQEELKAESNSSEQSVENQADETPDNLQAEESENQSKEVDSDESNDNAKGEDSSAELKKFKDEVVRLHAEMDNLRKRNAREMDNLRKFAVDKFAKALIPVADSMDKALEVSAKDDCEVTAAQMIEGTEMTQKVFLKVLGENGIEVLNPVNEKFNPEFHEAMAQVPNPDLEANTVVDVFQKGYVLNGRLIRPAMVVVSK